MKKQKTSITKGNKSYCQEDITRCLSPRIPGIDPRPVLMEFMVTKNVTATGFASINFAFHCQYHSTSVTFSFTYVQRCTISTNDNILS